MSTYTLTKSNLTGDFTLASDGDVQILVSATSIFDGATLTIEYETAVADVYIPVPEMAFSAPISKIVTFKAGDLRVKLSNTSDKTNVIVDVK